MSVSFVLLVFNDTFGAVKLIFFIWTLLTQADINSYVLSIAVAFLFKLLKPSVVGR